MVAVAADPASNDEQGSHIQCDWGNDRTCQSNAIQARMAEGNHQTNIALVLNTGLCNVSLPTIAAGEEQLGISYQIPALLVPGNTGQQADK